MPNYDFRSLSSYDFECLSRDLIQEERNITLESFKTGRDGGIDFRYAKDSSNKIVVQAKHYADSTYSLLFNKLKNYELSKIKRVNPSQYFLTISLGLTPANKDDIKTLLEPYCLSTADIYGKDDLNNLLGKFPHIEKRNFKLWLTSQPILEKIIHSKIVNQTEFELEYIKKRLKYYVQNESFFEANKILDELHYCIIAGIPGIGKTTLAEILLIAYLDRGCEIIKISNDIAEAFEIYDTQRKQIFYYNDFLGQTRLGERLNKNEDERILRFIEIIKKSKHNRFIMTTREYILNQAKENYEKLAHSDFDSKKCVINLASYTKFDRAKILFNHVYFSDLPVDFKQELLENKNYKKIINHKNFNPRIIEWMTEYIKNMRIESKGYIPAFLKNLDNPAKIWEHAFNKQISEASRCLLIVLYSLPEEVFVDNLELAFQNFYENWAIQCNFPIFQHDFKVSLKEIEENFIIIDSAGARPIIRFHNPSIKDFIEHYLMKESRVVKALVGSIIYFEQYIKLCGFEFMQKKFSPMLELLKKYPELIWSGIENNFESSNCSLITIKHHDGRITKQYSEVSLEIRLLFALELVNVLNSKESLRIISSMLERLIKSYELKKGNKWGLLELLGRLSDAGFKYVSSQKDFLVKIKQFLMNNVNEIDDYVYLVEFAEDFPEIFSQQDLDRIHAGFIDFYKEDISCALDMEESDFIYQYKESLERVAEYLKIDVADEIGELEYKAEEIAKFEPPFDDYDMYDWSKEESYLEEEQIESLFDSLEN